MTFAQVAGLLDLDRAELAAFEVPALQQDGAGNAWLAVVDQL